MTAKRMIELAEYFAIQKNSLRARQLAGLAADWLKRQDKTFARRLASRSLAASLGTTSPQYATLACY